MTINTPLVTGAVLKNAGSNQTDIVTATTGRVFVAQSPEQFTHDADGNLTNDGRWAYSWDAENRLTKAESLTNAPTASKRKVEWTYDHQGRRIRQTTCDGSSGSYVTTGDLKFLYDGLRCVAELNATNNVPVRSYTWGLDLSGTTDGAGGVGGLLMINSAANGAHFYGMDGNGNVVALVAAANGSMSAQYEYSPFGELLRATGSMARENPYRFSTKRTDDTTGLVLYEYRPYQPPTGRWPSRDPLEEVSAAGLYQYVRNCPVDLSDVLGLATLELLEPKQGNGARWNLKPLPSAYGGVTYFTYREVKCCLKCCDPVTSPLSKYKIRCKMTARMHITLNSNSNPYPRNKAYAHEQVHIDGAAIDLKKLRQKLQKVEEDADCKYDLTSATNWATAQENAYREHMKNTIRHWSASAPYHPRAHDVSYSVQGTMPDHPQDPEPDPAPTKCGDF